MLHFRGIFSFGTCELSKQVTVLCKKIWDSNYLYLHFDQVLSILSNWKYSYRNIGDERIRVDSGHFVIVVVNDHENSV